MLTGLLLCDAARPAWASLLLLLLWVGCLPLLVLLLLVLWVSCLPLLLLLRWVSCLPLLLLLLLVLLVLWVSCLPWLLLLLPPVHLLPLPHDELHLCQRNLRKFQLGP
jgi:hypothetical protein